MSVDREVLEATFRSRIQLAKMPEDQALEEARTEWLRAQAWVLSESTREGSLRWYCDEFDLDVSAVRRGIRERR